MVVEKFTIAPKNEELINKVNEIIDNLGGEIPSNMVTTNTAQDISGRKTFLGEKAIYFKQQATSNKLGFTLYNPSNTELAALEYRPNTINGASLLALNCPQTTGGYVGFRYWGTPAVNIVAPKVATAGNYFMTTHITNGSTTVTANNVGTVNISTLLPDVSNFITKTVNDLTNYYLKSETYTKQEVNQLIADIPKFTVTVVQELPLTGQPMVLYLVPKDGDTPDVHNEYIWITSTSSYELIGTTAVDLDGYATEQWVENKGYVTSSDLSTTLTNYQGKLTAGTDLEIVNNIINFTNESGYITGIDSTDVINALGYTPENKSNKVTSISSSSTNTQYPSAKSVYDAIQNVYSERNIGQIIQSTIPLTDAGLHLLDGSLIDGNGIYADFVNYIAGIYDSNSNYFCTETEWQQSITNYGVCGKFVYNSTNNTVRLPKITGFIEGTTDITTLGDITDAGLPNIEGQYINKDAYYDTTDGSGAFTRPNTIGTSGYTGTNSNTRNYAVLNFDASLSNSIYGNSDTVQPQSIKVLYYIVIANSTKTDIQVDIDEIATDLNNKLDKSEIWYDNTTSTLYIGVLQN